MGAEGRARDREKSAFLAVLVSEAGSDAIRQDSLSYLVECELARVAEPSSLADVGAGVESTYHLEYPGFRLEDALEALDKRGHIRRVEGPDEARYLLSADRLRVVRAQLDANGRFLESVMTEWIAEVRDTGLEVSDAQARVLSEVVQEYLAIWMEGYGLLKKAMFRAVSDMPGIESPDLGRVVAQKCKGYGDEWRRMATAAVAEFFNEPTPLRQRYLDRVFESYAELFLQYVEKTDGASPFGIEPAEQLVLVDTNAVLGLLGYDAELQQVCEAAVEASRSLGMTVAMTTRTKEEFLRVLDGADGLYRSMCGPQRVRPEAAAAATVRRLDNVFVESFLRQSAEGRQQTWGQFCARARQVAELVKAHGVETQPLVAGLVGAGRRVELDSLVRRFSSGKGPGTREHDVFHYLAVRKWRTEMQNQWACWFVTLDTSLPFFDYEARKTEAQPGVAFCMSPSCWLAWLRKTTPAKLKGVDLAGVGAVAFHLPFHRSEANTAGIVRVIAATDDWRDSPDVILAAANDELLQQEARKAWAGKNPAGAIDQALTRAVGEAKGELSGRLRPELERLRRQVAQLELGAAKEKEERERREVELAKEAGRAGAAETRAEKASEREAAAWWWVRALAGGAVAVVLSTVLVSARFALAWPAVTLPACLLPLAAAAGYLLWVRSRLLAFAVVLLGLAAAAAPWVWMSVADVGLSRENEMLLHARVSTAVEVALFIAAAVSWVRRSRPRSGEPSRGG